MTNTPTNTLLPSTSSLPTGSVQLSTQPYCAGADQDTCGCGLVHQVDYRGSIRTTSRGVECSKGQFCRNPDDGDAASRGRASCKPESVQKSDYSYGDYDDDYEPCSIPFCFPPPTSCFSLLSRGADPCQLARCSFGCLARRSGTELRCSWKAYTDFNKTEWDDTSHARSALESCPSHSIPCSSDGHALIDEVEAGCAYHECIADHGDTSVNIMSPLREDLGDICRCAYEIWDCRFGSQGCLDFNSEIRKDHECCNSKAHATIHTASCDCFIEPKCDAESAEACSIFGKRCCQEGDQECQCNYHTRACRLGLESGLEDQGYCEDARDACCADDNTFGGCKCSFWYSLCEAYPESKISNPSSEIGCGAAKRCNDHLYTNSTVSACHFAINHRVGDYTTCCMLGGRVCECDFVTHMEEIGLEGFITGYPAFDWWDRATVCDQADDARPLSIDSELGALKNIYSQTSGYHWSNNTGWMSDSSHCNWYGVMCDTEGYVTKINLNKNNITGKFPADPLSVFRRLSFLNLSENNLSGTMFVSWVKLDWWKEPSLDTSMFYRLQELTHVYLSHNNLIGAVDALFLPALVEVDFSHNNFTSFINFMKFKSSHKTLIKCNFSHNTIQEKASKVMENLPPNLEELILSNNRMHGTLPQNMEELSRLKRLDISTNMLSGGLPDFSRVYPNLQVLNLSNQKQGKRIGLTGIISNELLEFNFLSTLNLGGNSFTGTVPPALGNMGLLTTLDLSNNLLSERIPPNLGNLEGELHVMRL